MTIEAIIEMFSKHPRINNNNERPAWKPDWEPDSKLEANIRNLCHSDPNMDTEFWARFFLKTLGEPLALRHMVAYLERLGYQAAENVYKKLSNFQHYTQFRYERYDIWQIAWSFSSRPTEIFRKFNPQQPLKKYAYKTIEGKIRDEIVRLGMGRLRADWALLRHCGRAYLREALQNEGLRQLQLERCLLAWRSFKEIYTSKKAPDSRTLPEPQNEQLEQMTDLYNNLVQSPQVAALGTADRAEIEAWLRQCIQALRRYQNRIFVPIDAPRGGHEDSPPLLETIPDPKSESRWEQIEIQQTAEQLMAVLREMLTQIDEEADNCLLMRHGFDLDYRSIAPFFNVYYTTVRNRYNSEMLQLREGVARWAQEELDVTPDSESLDEMHIQLQECLNKYYFDLIFQSVFRPSWQQLDCQRRNILYLRYFMQKDEVAIARQLALSELEVSNKLVTGKQELAAAIQEWIQNRTNVLPNLLNPLVDRIATFVERLIADYQS
jgi:DNA-directed RNA polymerase specialized sigma24 family protein